MLEVRSRLEVMLIGYHKLLRGQLMMFGIRGRMKRWGVAINLDAWGSLEGCMRGSKRYLTALKY